MSDDGRRVFLKICVGGVAIAAAGAVAYPVISYLAPRQRQDEGGTVAIPDREIPEGGAKFFPYRGRTGVVVRKKDGSLAVLSAVCTHLGCIVQWQGNKDEFLCPCHGGRFAADGRVLGGPPPKPLEQVRFTVANGVITIG